MGVMEAIGREARFLGGVVRMVRRLKDLKPDAPLTVPDLVEKQVKALPNNIAIRFEDRTYSYAEFDAAANRVARWAQRAGIKRGDSVALLMENRPEYLITWFGITKIGGAVALINTNLQAQPLAHSLAICGAKHVVLGAELAENFATAAPLLDAPVTVWVSGGRTQGYDDLDAALAREDGAALAPDLRAGMTAADRCFYIYTSGTTGLPKAANMSHMRVQTMMQAFAASTNSKSTDRVYDVLPLYHSSGGVCALGMAFGSGGSVILRRKFSASHFWDDCHKYEATIFQYIGELCRYLLNTPEHPLERSHKLRIAIGNGLRPEIWPQFQSRFKIPRIFEFYGATEGNVALMNYDNRVGAVGRIPSYMRKILPTRIVRFDVELEQPVRDPATGLCIECGPDETGEAIGLIKPDDPRTRFEGYTKKQDSEKKLLRDVFEKGDTWFRTGDLMKRDKLGYFYFVDRIGDTFRWKGENVATSEVAEAIGVLPGVKEANVYGVTIPGADGRAGMASLVVQGETDLSTLYAHVEKELPAYARPYFIRLQSEIEITGTFKHRKVELVKDGFDPRRIGDPLYFRDDAKGAYVPLDGGLYQRIVTGDIKL